MKLPTPPNPEEKTPLVSPITLEQILQNLPIEPGVYLMKDHHETVIYVGKAQNLKHRVRSYFTRSGDDRKFVSKLENLVGTIDTIVTKNEKEALLLENTLIKKYKPRFNIKLMDDKNYLLLRLNNKVLYPRLEVVRKTEKDGARYFGPYHSAQSCRQTLQIINRHFKLRTCTDQVMKSRTRPCLQYQIKRCDAPCVFEVPLENYGEQVQDVTLFLQGKSQELINNITERMKIAAQNLEYEVASTLRDQLLSLKKTLETQHVVSPQLTNQDVFGYYRQGTEFEIAVLSIRQGKLSGRKTYYFRDQEFEDTEVLSSFLSLYYDAGNEIPEEILLPLSIEDQNLKEEWLNEHAQKLFPGNQQESIQILCPKRGDRQRLIELAHKNAAAAYQTERNKIKDTEQTLVKLQKRLNLKRVPKRIECFDISHLQGNYPVASRVVFIEGEPARSEYRVFQIKTSKNDDFASMYEVISRRLRRSHMQPTESEGVEKEGRGKNTTPQAWALPDLIVIDGGKGQLASALAAIKDCGHSLHEFDIIGLAKEREDQSGTKQPDRVFLPKAKDPILLRPNTTEMFVLSQIRDEAHRFAITYHKKKRSQKTIRSSLSDIPGIGPRRQKELLKVFGSVEKIKKASLEELIHIPSMNQTAAISVLTHFGSASFPTPKTTVSIKEQQENHIENMIENAADQELASFETAINQGLASFETGEIET